MEQLIFSSVVTDVVAMPSSIENLPHARASAAFTDPKPVFKEDGEIVHLHNCIALPNKAAARYSGTQNFKVLASGPIRKIRLVCIFRINGLEVFL